MTADGVIPPPDEPSDKSDEFTSDERTDAGRSASQQRYLAEQRHNKYLAMQVEYFKGHVPVETANWNLMHGKLRSAESQLSAYRAARWCGSMLNVVTTLLVAVGGGLISTFPKDTEKSWPYHLVGWSLLVIGVVIQLALGFVPIRTMSGVEVDVDDHGTA